MEFANKTAIVTGAAGAIGKEIARRLATEGAKVVITDLKQDALDATAKECGPNVKGIAADVTKYADVQRVVAESLKFFGGKIDVLANVAGVTGQGGPVEDISEETWDFVYAVNCKGTFFFIKEVVPVMKKQGSGSILNFSSKSGKTGSALMSAYSSAKAAIIGLTQALAYELAKSNIRVNCVCPGITAATGVWTCVSADYVENMKLPMDQIVKQFTAKVPLGRLANVEDIVNASCFLLSDSASYMTGQAMNVTGGREMH
jgi:NAD(P)-dependent dehydrogenase (short-subunit alcohol dehydrogenase family)